MGISILLRRWLRIAALLLASLSATAALRAADVRVQRAVIARCSGAVSYDYLLSLPKDYDAAPQKSANVEVYDWLLKHRRPAEGDLPAGVTKPQPAPPKGT